MASLQEYMELIGLNLPVKIEPNLQLLKEIIHAHLRTFSYQNAELVVQGKKPRLERIVPPLEIESLFEKMRMERSGYCFQNSELLAWALTHLGFEVTKHLAKSINCLSHKIREGFLDEVMISHELLLVKLPEHEISHWVIDAGCGDNSLREPLALRTGEQLLGPELYRFSHPAETLQRLEIKTHQGWLSLYEFDLIPKSQVQIDEAHHQLFLSPQVPLIRSFLKLGLVTDEKRKGLAFFENQACFFKSRSNFKKEYDLVALTSETKLNRHTLAVKVDEDGNLVYSVLDPHCPKEKKSIITGTLTPVDLEQKIGIEQTTSLFACLRHPINTEICQLLLPFLPSLLFITAERGHTHRRERPVASVDELFVLAKEKFGIRLDETVRAAFS